MSALLELFNIHSQLLFKEYVLQYYSVQKYGPPHLPLLLAPPWMSVLIRTCHFKAPLYVKIHQLGKLLFPIALQ